MADHEPGAEIQHHRGDADPQQVLDQAAAGRFVCFQFRPHLRRLLATAHEGEHHRHHEGQQQHQPVAPGQHAIPAQPDHQQAGQQEPQQQRRQRAPADHQRRNERGQAQRQSEVDDVAADRVAERKRLAASPRGACVDRQFRQRRAECDQQQAGGEGRQAHVPAEAGRTLHDRIAAEREQDQSQREHPECSDHPYVSLVVGVGRFYAQAAAASDRRAAASARIAFAAFGVVDLGTQADAPFADDAPGIKLAGSTNPACAPCLRNSLRRNRPAAARRHGIRRPRPWRRSRRSVRHFHRRRP